MHEAAVPSRIPAMRPGLATRPRMVRLTPLVLPGFLLALLFPGCTARTQGQGNNSNSNPGGGGTILSLTSITPTSGSDFVQNTVTLTGKNFTSPLSDPTWKLTFGGIAINPATDILGGTPTTANILTPLGVAPGPADVTMTNQWGTATLVQAFTFLGFRIDSISPSMGPPAIQTQVTLTGNGFTDPASDPSWSVTFGGIAAAKSGVTVSPDTATMTLFTPVGMPAGLVDVTVTNQNGTGTLTGAFCFLGLSAVQPSSSPPSTSIPVTLTGCGFTTAADTQVTFDGIPATNVAVPDPQTVTCDTPPLSTFGLVTVTVTNSNGTFTLPGGFKVDPPKDFVEVYLGVRGGPGFSDAVGGLARFTSPTALATDGTGIFVADRDNHVLRRVDIATGGVQTIAGTPGVAGWQDGIPGMLAGPQGLALDPAGQFLYVTDTANHVIRRVDLITGVLQTVAGVPGTAGWADTHLLKDPPAGGLSLFDSPSGLAWESATNFLYVADTANHVIRRVDLAGFVPGDDPPVTTLAGLPGAPGYCAGNGFLAQFDTPRGLAIDETHRVLFVADRDNAVVRYVCLAAASGGPCAATTVPNQQCGSCTVPIEGCARLVAGSPGAAGCKQGQGSAARFLAPEGLLLDPAANVLYVADQGLGQGSTIRSIPLAPLYNLPGSQAPAVALLAGACGAPGDFADQVHGDAARFDEPSGLTATFPGPGPEPLLWLADRQNQVLRTLDLADLDPTGMFPFVRTVAGAAPRPGSEDGIAGLAPGPGIAQFDGPGDLAVWPATFGFMLADTGNDVIRSIASCGGTVSPCPQATTIAGTAGKPCLASQLCNTTTGSWACSAVGTSARLAMPVGLAVHEDALGAQRFFFSDRNTMTLRVIDSSILLGGQPWVGRVAGVPWTTGFADGDGTCGPTGATFTAPAGVAVIGDRVFVADTGNHTIRYVDLETFLQSGQPQDIVAGTLAGSATDPQNLFQDGNGFDARFHQPYGLTHVTQGGLDYLVVAEIGNHTLRLIDINGVTSWCQGCPVSLQAQVKTLAGTPGIPGSADGSGDQAFFNRPQGVAFHPTDLAGPSVWVADAGNHMVRKTVLPPDLSLPGATIQANTWVVTVTGSPTDSSTVEDDLSLAILNTPVAVGFTADGAVVVDTAENVVRRVVP